MDLVQKDHYRTLGLRPGASDAAIHKAYTDRAKLAHPDMGGSYEAMVSLNEAYNILKDSSRKFWYDREMGFDTVRPFERGEKKAGPSKVRAKRTAVRSLKKWDTAASLAIKIAVLMNLVVLLTLLFAFLFVNYLR
ncbi:J domain-containing protein [Candidatus Saccharibacteria bacterium]|nr:J domain-containing protein [Candidatus Saccharibacteria bacterium]